jgi:hypothetical protein
MTDVKIDSIFMVFVAVLLKNKLQFLHFSCRRMALKLFYKWKVSNRKQNARWQHVSWLKASAFCIW